MSDLKAQLIRLGSDNVDLRPPIKLILEHMSNSRTASSVKDHIAAIEADLKKAMAQGALPKEMEYKIEADIRRKRIKFTVTSLPFKTSTHALLGLAPTKAAEAVKDYVTALMKKHNKDPKFLAMVAVRP